MTQPGTVDAEQRDVPAAVRAQANRLLLWYPSGWRARYGDEFAELLAAELIEQPHSLGRSVDVARSGLRARLADAGLGSHPLDQAAAARAGLATLACSGALFATFGAAMWSQLATGLQWSVPDDRGIAQALDLMSLGLLTFGVVAAFGAVVLVRSVIRSASRDGRRILLRPAALAVTGAGILIVGGRHFGNGWPGTGGHLLAAQGHLPGGVAAFCWAATMWITSYWAHPAMLAAFPPTQIVWMVISPAAGCCFITGVVQLLRRVDRSPRTICYETWLGRVAAAGMILFLCGVFRWLSAAGSGEHTAFHVGAIDFSGLIVLVLVVAFGLRAVRRAGIAGRAMAAVAGSGPAGR